MDNLNTKKRSELLTTGGDHLDDALLAVNLAMVAVRHAVTAAEETGDDNTRLVWALTDRLDHLNNLRAAIVREVGRAYTPEGSRG